MIVIVGGMGTLGRNVVRQLRARGERVRVMTRNVLGADGLRATGAEVVPGDLRDAESLRAALRDARIVVSAAHSMVGTGKSSSARVDDDGQRALVDAAKEAGVEHFVFTSVLGASATHPVDFWRTKVRTEARVEASGLPYTIVRPSAYMEMHAYELIGKAVLQGKPVPLFGPGTNKKNFVAANDVATLIVRAIDDVALRNQTIEIGGPQNLSSLQVVGIFEKLAGTKAKVIHLPLAALRVIAPVARAIHAGVGRVIAAGIIGETTDQTFDSAPFSARFGVRLATLEDWARLNCGALLPDH